MNILGIVYRYKTMKEMSAAERRTKFVPRVCIFGGKAFATYVQAKRIVKFITDVGSTVNHDPEIGDLLKVWMDLILDLVNEFCERWAYIIYLYYHRINNLTDSFAL